MKGYQVNKKLYVFPQTAAEIPYVDPEVEVIYIQHEDLAAFKEANSDYAALMVGYNYNVMTVKPKEWAGHTNDDIVVPEPPAPTTYSITLSQEGEYCHGSWDGNVEAGASCSLIPESGYSFDQTVAGTIILAGSDQVELTFNSETGNMDFTMPAEDVTVTAYVYQIRNTISYEGDATEHVTGPANGAGGEQITITPSEGYTFDESMMGSATVLGVRAFNASDETVELEVTVDTANDTASFTMPAYAVRVTVDVNAGDDSDDLPEAGTVYDFVGYVDDSTSTPSSTGQITYEGEYDQDTDYVYGTANVLFAGAGSAQQVTVYMTKTDFANALEGTRVMVYALDNSSLTGFGYGELTQLPTFETLNITQDQNSDLSASVQTDTDWTGKTVYASVYDNDSNVLYLQLIPDGTDPTLLVLDTDYDGNIADATYLDSNSTGSVTVSNLVENRTYTCGYSWTNEVVGQ